MNTSLPPQFFAPSLSGTAAVPSAAGLTLAGEPATDTGFAAAFAQFLGQLPVTSPATLPAAPTAPAASGASVAGAVPSAAPLLGLRPFAPFAAAVVAPVGSPLAPLPSAPSALTAPTVPAPVSKMPAGALSAAPATSPALVTPPADQTAPESSGSWNQPDSAPLFNLCEPITSVAAGDAPAAARPAVTALSPVVHPGPALRSESIPSPGSGSMNESWLCVAEFSADECLAAAVGGDSDVTAALAPAELAALEAATELDRAALENLLALLVPAAASPAEGAPVSEAPAGTQVATHPSGSSYGPANTRHEEEGPQTLGRHAHPEMVTHRATTGANIPRAAVDESDRVQIAGMTSGAGSSPAFVRAEVQAANGARIALRPIASGGIALEILPKANSAAGEDLTVTTLSAATGATEKTFLSDSRQAFATESAGAGTAVAEKLTDMPAAFIAPAAPAATTSEWLASAAPVIEAIEVRQELPADATGRAAAAVHAVVEVAEAQAASRLQPVPAVTLRFDFQGEPLSVRVEMRDGEVRTEFRTNSPELSSALAHEWRAVAVQADAGTRLADPVFSTPSRASDAGTTGNWDQQSSQNRPSGQMPEQFAGARTVRATRSASAPVAATEAAPVAAGAARPATSRRLSVLA